ncbi:ATP-binding protein [Paracoccus sp. p4-l81]|uniref:sensor histidine kinase NtrY-like n=1 Tax=unclassified Paracoccus (in: a-proteobacteria) TaxID=2688777 RepID=UPI0035BA0D8C
MTRDASISTTGPAVQPGLWQRLGRRGARRRVLNILTLLLVALGPVLALATFAALGPFGRGLESGGLRTLLLVDLVYLLVVAGLVLTRLARAIIERRRGSAGSRLHARLAAIFTGVALVPTILVAVFGGLTVNIGLDGWFSDRVQRVVATSLDAAEAYQNEHRRDLTADARALRAMLAAARDERPLISDGDWREVLTAGQMQVQRGLKEAFVIDGTGQIRARGDRSYLFDYEQPSPADLDRARAGETVLIEDWSSNEFRALAQISPLTDRFVYISRAVDGDLLGLLDDTRETVGLYNQLEATRGRMLAEFALLYLGFALLLTLAAMWLGLWLAERLSRPIGQLAQAAERVGGGDLDVQVRPASGNDEIATLGQVFNTMTRQLKAQRDALVAANATSEERGRRFDSVLSSVTSGVIGLDAAGEVDFLNRSAQRLLALDPARDHDRPLAEAVPEFAALFARLTDGIADVVQEEIRVSRDGRLESLLVRIAKRHAADGNPEGYVVAFEDVTELVSAQRMAAWGDVARRIAHEIKNPLTPIALSAERLRRKFAPLAGDQAEALDQYTGVIIRQTGDLRRIIDEFSKFARMPEPDRRDHDLARLLRDIATLQQDALDGARLVADIPPGDLVMTFDDTMIGQAITNLVKNAGEAIGMLRQKGAPEGWQPQVHLSLTTTPDAAIIRIRDNGIGLPEDRSRLFEPYVTHRPGGTGLGLPIVKKIIEEHGGALVLTDGPDDLTPRGAQAEIRLPRARGATGNGHGPSRASLPRSPRDPFKSPVETAHPEGGPDMQTEGR